MPILIQCASCSRKLRVQDHLLGKFIKCPNCQAKFQAQPIQEPSLQPVPAASPPPLSAAGEEMQQTPLIPPVNQEMVAAEVQILELSEPVSPPPKPASEPRSNERVAAVLAPPPQTPPAPAPLGKTPPAPPPFPTPALKVFAILSAFLFLTAVVGLGLSWLVAAAIERAVEARQSSP